MIGQRVESRRRLPLAAFASASLGFALLAGGAALGQPRILLAAALPTAIGAALLVLGRDRPFAASFGEEALEVEGLAGAIPYASLRDVRAAGIPHAPASFRKAAAPIQVEHAGGLLQIPARLTSPSHEVYRFLAGRVPPNGDRGVNPALGEYLERQEAYFGPGRVWTFRAAERRSRSGRYRKLRAICLGLVLGGVAWMVAGFSGWAESGWGAAGILCSLIGGCFYLASLAEGSSTNRMVKNWRSSSLVIGPQGMAMVQGDIQGEVRWPELLDVKFRPKSAAFRLTYAQGQNGIILKVKGADILIADVYDRPLYLIYERILVESGRLPADLDPAGPFL